LSDLAEFLTTRSTRSLSATAEVLDINYCSNYYKVN